MDFIDEVIMTRASVRSFTGQTISQDDLLRMAKAGFAAPSGVNIQPWDLVLVTDRAVLDQLNENLPYAKMLEKAGAAFVICGNPQKDERFTPMTWEQDCSAMTENILLAAHALGYGAVWTAVHPVPERVEAVRKILGIPEGIIPLSVVPVGVIAGPKPVVKNKFRPEALHQERW